MPLPEKELISRIRRVAASARSHRVLTGIGDDCAVLRLPRGHEMLVTTDFSLEGIHFRRDWHSPESVGHRCLARGLSDIAAMGGEPIAAFLSLALPREVPQTWVEAFMKALTKMSKRHGVVLAGGDTAQSPTGILADIVVVGSVRKGKAVLRSTARPGDRIYVSGDLGGSAATVIKMERMPNQKLNPSEYPRHFAPEPRIGLGRYLREKNLANSMIDTSDGLSTDLAHICEESDVGAIVNGDRIPRAWVGRPAHEVDLNLALHGGEDYELLFTVPSRKRIPREVAGVPLTQIGEITKSRKIFLRNTDGSTRALEARGWEHFRGK